MDHVTAALASLAPAGQTPPEAAEAAARRAGVVVRELSTAADCHEATALLAEVWRTQVTDSPVQANLLRALQTSGGYAVGASADGVLVAASVGFLARPRQDGPDELHSHITGVRRGEQRRGLGRAVKLHQRAWALERGITSIGWTFDPLVRRNLVFNLVGLGACLSRYLPDFYGDMSDGVNAGQGSDRVHARWDLLAPLPGARPPRPEVPEPPVALLLRPGADGRPVAAPGGGADRVGVQVPADIESLRSSDPSGAAAWRTAVRAALGGAMADGWTVDGARPDGTYLLGRPGTGQETR